MTTLAADAKPPPRKWPVVVNVAPPFSTAVNTTKA
jgi:hypothetical protein